MAAYIIDKRVFDTFPAFRRGVVIATGIDNSGPDPEIARLLAAVAAQVTPSPSAAEGSRISAWNDAYLRFGVDPNRYTPSVRFLLEQVRKGRPVRSINKVVDVMNLTSIRWCAPCGGDDLHSLEGGDLCLGLAQGDETFAPLFKPSNTEKPLPGEVIYYTPQTRRVMCRRWTWRNADFSKLTPATSAVAINIDIVLGPFDESDLDAALAGVVVLLRRFCSGKIETHVLSPTNTRIQIDNDVLGKNGMENMSFVSAQAPR